MRWTVTADHALESAVRRYGNDWAAISRVLERKRCSCMKRWKRLAPSYVPSYLPAVVPETVQPPSHVSVVFHPLLVNSGRGLHRSESGGRPWNFAIRDAIGRPLTKRQAELLSLWCVCPCPDVGGWLLCNLKTAEQKLRRSLIRCGVRPSAVARTVLTLQLTPQMRDFLGLAIRQGAAGSTVTSSNAAYNFVSFGTHGRFLTANEVASFVGLNCHEGPVRLLTRPGVAQSAVFRCIGESIHSRCADSVVCAADAQTVGKGHS